MKIDRGIPNEGRSRGGAEAPATSCTVHETFECHPRRYYQLNYADRGPPPGGTLLTRIHGDSDHCSEPWSCDRIWNYADFCVPALRWYDRPVRGRKPSNRDRAPFESAVYLIPKWDRHLHGIKINDSGHGLGRIKHRPCCDWDARSR